MGLGDAAGTVTGGHGLRLATDGGWDGQRAVAADMLFVPGGMGGVENLRADPRVLRAIRARAEAGKDVAAICAGPLVLDAAGVIGEDTAYTCYPGLEVKMKHPDSWQDEVVVRSDDGIWTSQGPATAMDLGLALLDALAGDETGEEVADELLCDRGDVLEFEEDDAEDWFGDEGGDWEDDDLEADGDWEEGVDGDDAEDGEDGTRE